MGSDQSKDIKAYGEIYIQIDKPSYISGENIKGKVYLNLKKNFPGRNIIIKFKGREYIQWLMNDHATRRKDNRLKKKTYNNIGNLYTSPQDQIAAGQYCFPFIMLLPPDLPGTFFQKRDKILSEIYYCVEAILQPNNKSHPNMKYKHLVVINEIPNKIPETKNITHTMNLELFWCINRGSLTMFASFQKNVYVPGEIANVVVEIDNRKSRLNCNRIKFSLKQKFTLEARNTTIQKEYVIVSRDTGGVAAGILGERKIISLNLPQAEFRNKLQGTILYEIPNASTNEVLTMNPTTHGKLITSEYFLEIQAEMSGICSNSPKITIPILINAPGIKEPSIIPPENWNPRVMETYNLCYAPKIDIDNNNNNIPQDEYSGTKILYMGGFAPFHCEIGRT